MPTYKVLVQHMPNNQHVIMDVEFEKLPSDFKRWGWDHFARQPIYAPENTPDDRLDSKLNHKRKVKFESELAFIALKNNQLMRNTLNNVGKAMAEYLDSHLQDNKEKAGRVFRNAFYSDKNLFGTLGKQSDKTDLESYKEGLSHLYKGKAIEHVFTAYIAAVKIYREVLLRENHPEFIKWWQLFRDKKYFEKEENRARIKLKDNKEQILTDKPGIEDVPTIKAKVQEHKRALDKTIRDPFSANFAWNSYQHELPFVAGPSGTASECFAGLKTLGRHANLTKEELKEFIFACASYLVCSGAHSFHEVYCITQPLGVEYNAGRYENIIPESLKRLPDFQKWISEFPDIVRIEELRSSIRIDRPSSAPIPRTFTYSHMNSHHSAPTSELKSHDMEDDESNIKVASYFQAITTMAAEEKLTSTIDEEKITSTVEEETITSMMDYRNDISNNTSIAPFTSNSNTPSFNNENTYHMNRSSSLMPALERLSSQSTISLRSHSESSNSMFNLDENPLPISNQLKLFGLVTKAVSPLRSKPLPKRLNEKDNNPLKVNDDNANVINYFSNDSDTKRIKKI